MAELLSILEQLTFCRVCHLQDVFPVRSFNSQLYLWLLSLQYHKMHFSVQEICSMLINYWLKCIGSWHSAARSTCTAGISAVTLTQLRYERLSWVHTETSVGWEDFYKAKRQDVWLGKNLADRSDRSLQKCLLWFCSSHIFRNNLCTHGCRSNLSGAVTLT